MIEAVPGTITALAGGALILAGVGLVLIGAIGLVRMPDLYTRMHAAGIIDSCGGIVLLLGLAVHAGIGLVAAKLLVLVALLFFAGPVATHALARAALHAGVAPTLATDRRGAPPVDAQEPFREAAQ